MGIKSHTENPLQEEEDDTNKINSKYCTQGEQIKTWQFTL